MWIFLFEWLGFSIGLIVDFFLSVRCMQTRGRLRNLQNYAKPMESWMWNWTCAGLDLLRRRATQLSSQRFSSPMWKLWHRPCRDAVMDFMNVIIHSSEARPSLRQNTPPSSLRQSYVDFGSKYKHGSKAINHNETTGRWRTRAWSVFIDNHVAHSSHLQECPVVLYQFPIWDPKESQLCSSTRATPWFNKMIGEQLWLLIYHPQGCGQAKPSLSTRTLSCSLSLGMQSPLSWSLQQLTLFTTTCRRKQPFRRNGHLRFHPAKF